MSDHPFPMFDESAPPVAPDTPKKPRRKPMKRRKTAKIAVPKKARRKRKISPSIPERASSKFPPKVYELIGALMNLETPLRSFVIEVTRALDK